jgi:hypothetical protein
MQESRALAAPAPRRTAVRPWAPSLRAYLDDATDDCESDVRDIARAHLEQPA